MVSRRRILSRSTDDLNLEAPVEAEEEDVWFNKDKLYMVKSFLLDLKRLFICLNINLIHIFTQLQKIV